MKKLGWLSPTGELLECNAYDHIVLADYLVNKLNYTSVDYNSNEDLLLDMGWVQISICALTHRYAIWWAHSHILTREQKDFLNTYFENRDSVLAGSYMQWERDNDLR